MGKDFNTGLRRSLEYDRIKLTRRRKRILREMGYSEELTAAETAEKLREQRLAYEALSRINERVEREIAEIRNLIEARDARIAELTKEIASLEARLGRPVKTSANSSVPPSKNPIGVPHTQSLREKSGRPSGGQKGHVGTTRRQETVEADRTEMRVPPQTCPVCGKPLDMDNATIGETRQVIDIPLPIMYIATNYVSLDVKCDCGHCCKGVFPEGVNAPVSFGPNIKALVTYLSTYQNVPFKRLTHILESLFGLKMSEGSVSNILNGMRKCSKKPYEMIRQRIAKSPVAGADETGINVGGKNNWMWTFQNRVATYLTVDGSRSHEVIGKAFPSGELSDKVLVTDRLPAYFMDEVDIRDHQVCLAHLLRNLTYTMQTFKGDPWSLDMMDLLKESIHARNRGATGPEFKDTMQKRLDELLDRPPVYKFDDGKPTELDRLKAGIRKHGEYIFTFLTNPEVPPTNNDSEKALRPAKTKLKVSGCFRSKEGAENYATIGSVIQTAVKNGQDPFEVLRVVATVATE